MAEKDIVGGIFGLTPEMYQRGLAAKDTATNLAAAQLAPGQLAGYYAMEAGTGLGRAVPGLLGVEDPQLALIRKTNQLVQQHLRRPRWLSESQKRRPPEPEFPLSAESSSAATAHHPRCQTGT